MYIDMSNNSTQKPNKNWFMKKTKPTRAETKPFVDALRVKMEEKEKEKIKIDEVPF